MAYRPTRYGRKPFRRAGGRRRVRAGGPRWNGKKRSGGYRGGGAGFKTLQKRVAAMERVNKRSAKLRNFPEKIDFFVEDSEANMITRERYLPVPVSQAIPSSAVQGKGRTVKIRYVKLRFTVVHQHGVQVSAALHRNGVSPISYVPVNINNPTPRNFHLGPKDGTKLRMYSLEETQILKSRKGPYEVETETIVYEGGQVDTTASLGSLDGSIFECPTAKGENGPIGKVEYYCGRKGEPGCIPKIGKTVNLNIPKPTGEAVEQTPVTLFFTVNKEVEFEQEGYSEIVGNHLEMMLMICSTAGQLGGPEEKMGYTQQAQRSGHARDFMLEVYYE